jgi:hypothetical protein
MFTLNVGRVLAAVMMLTVVSAAPSLDSPVPFPGKTPAQPPDSPYIYSLITCNDVNLGGTCFTWGSIFIPSGCGDLSSSGQNDQVTSASTDVGLGGVSVGIQCTLFM